MKSRLFTNACFFFFGPLLCPTVGRTKKCCLHSGCQSESHYRRGHRCSAPGKPSLNRLLRLHFHQDIKKIINLSPTISSPSHILINRRMCLRFLLKQNKIKTYRLSFFFPPHSSNFSSRPHGQFPEYISGHLAHR